MGDSSQETKVFNDPVHGHIELHPLLVSIIDTPQFQRLRYIKQMGMSYFVFPGACHNRFEHSLGVSYLAGEFARNLKSNQEELDITDEDILCVKIAGLCHDIGHGPFSHLFDDAFLPKVTKNKVVKHETLSVRMFDYMLEDKKLKKAFKDNNLTQPDITFIKELIKGHPEKVRATQKHEKADESGKKLQIRKGQVLTVVDRREDYTEVLDGKGNKGFVPNESIKNHWSRGNDKSFLYEIVANKRNGIDVDKWDYFARDNLYLGIQNTFDWRRYIKFARVIEAHGEKQICIRDKEITTVYDMFHARYIMNRRVWEHGGIKIIEDMIAEALKEANNYLFFRGTNGKRKKMSQSISDMEAYSKLTDHVLWQIYLSTAKRLNISRGIIDRIFKRNLFVRIGHASLKSLRNPNDEVRETDVPQGIHAKLPENTQGSVKQTDIIVHVAKLSYGMGEEDPVEHLMFYSKHNPNTAIEKPKLRWDDMAVPRQFSERSLRVCIKQTDPNIFESVKEAFEEWCKEEELTWYCLGDSMEVFRPEEIHTES